MANTLSSTQQLASEEKSEFEKQLGNRIKKVMTGIESWPKAENHSPLIEMSLLNYDLHNLSNAGITDTKTAVDGLKVEVHSLASEVKKSNGHSAPSLTFGKLVIPLSYALPISLAVIVVGAFLFGFLVLHGKLTEVVEAYNIARGTAMRTESVTVENPKIVKK